MFEKVNAGHPDKMADRLAGAVKAAQYIQNIQMRAKIMKKK